MPMVAPISIGVTRLGHPHQDRDADRQQQRIGGAKGGAGDVGLHEVLAMNRPEPLEVRQGICEQ